LGGWNLVEKVIDNVIIGLKALELGFLKAKNVFGLFADKEERELIKRKEAELQFIRDQKNDKKQVREIEEKFTSKEGVVDTAKVKQEIDEKNLISSKYGGTLKKDETSGEFFTESGTGKIVRDTQTKQTIQADLDMLAIKSFQQREKLVSKLENAEKKGDEEDIAKAKAALKAADGFIANYDQIYGKGSLEQTMQNYQGFVDSRGQFQDRSVGRFLSIKDNVDIREFNDAGSNFSRFVLNSGRTGEVIEQQIKESKSSALIDNMGQGGYLARISAPNIATQINNAYNLDAIPTSKESIADSS
jgi:hypothetical protein